MLENFYFYKNTTSYLLKKMADRIGIDEHELIKELRLRAMLLYELARRKILKMKDFTQIIAGYYKNKDKILKEYGII